jgi:sugar phosphate permease
MFGGLLGVAVMMSLLSLMELNTTLWLMRALMFLIGAGMAYAFVSSQVAAFATISSAATGQASALFSAQRQLGSALGVAVLSSVLGIVGPTRLSVSGAVVPNVVAYHAAFFAAAALAIIAAVIALAIRDRDAAATMRQRENRVDHQESAEQMSSVEALS